MGNILALPEPIIDEWKDLMGTSIRMRYIPADYYVYGEDDLMEIPSQIHIYTQDGLHYSGYTYTFEHYKFPKKPILVDNCSVIKYHEYTPGCLYGLYKHSRYKYTINNEYIINCPLYLC
jgi:hypothetical protein